MVGWVPSPFPHGVKKLPFYPMENTFLTPWRVPLTLLGKGKWYFLPYDGYPMGVPVFHGVIFTSLWIGRGNFFTPWGYALHHAGTPYIMRVPTTTWNVFPYPTRGSTYQIGDKGTFYPIRKE